jgi:hypothetical protein
MRKTTPIRTRFATACLATAIAGTALTLETLRLLLG